jgi:16S rRNA (cytidine1402-2'-O)-methyltransferase
MRLMDERGTLYVVGTPIGNLEDLSDRARRVLSEVDLVAAEDTRRAGLLLRRIGARARFLSFFEANERERIPKVLAELGAGRSVALVTDAGMPGVSDPGYRLVAACAEAGLDVDVVPGPSAVVTALVVSGLPTDRFSFEGFLPRTGRGRRERLAQIAADPRTVVLFESPRRTARTLADLLEACGDRRAAMCRELTKVHQEVRRASLSELAASAERDEPKGEVTLVVEGAPEAGASASVDEAVALAHSLASDGMRKRDAAREAAARTGIPANRIYEALTAR